jgi:hypothetical protein
MSEDNFITIWDRDSEADRFHMTSMLGQLGINAYQKSLTKGKGRYSVLVCARARIAATGELIFVDVTDAAELRTVLRTLLDDCTAKGVADLPIRSASASARAVVDELSAEQQRAEAERIADAMPV